MISLGDALLRIGVDKTGFDQGLQEVQNQAKQTQQTFRALERVTRPLGVALVSVGAAGLAFTDDVKKWNKGLGSFMETLRPLFIVMTAFGGLLLSLPPLIKGVVVAINVLKVAMAGLRAAAIATQAAFGLLTLGVSMIAAGITMLVTHGRHVEAVAAETERWGDTLVRTNDRLHDLITAGEGASEEANNLRKAMDDLIKTYDVYNTIGEDNVVTIYNQADAEEKLAEAKEILSAAEEHLIVNRAAGREETEIGRQQMDNLEATIGNYKNTVLELTLGILDLKDAQEEETQAMIKNADALRDTEISKAEERYGLRANESISLMQQFEDETDARRESLDDQLDDVRKSTNDVIKEYQRVYDERVASEEGQTKVFIKALQDQIDALNRQRNAISQQREDNDNAETESELRAAVSAAWNRKDRADAEKKLADFLETVSEKKEDRVLEAQISALQEGITNTQNASDETLRLLQEELNANIENQNAILAASEITIQSELDSLNQAVIDKRAILQQELNDAVTVHNQIYEDAVRVIEDELAARIEASAILASIPATGPTEMELAMAEYKANRALRSNEGPSDGGGIAGGLANGGPILEPTLLLGLRTGQKRIAGEAGPEWVSPGGGGITITGNTFNVRSDADIPRIAAELLRQRMLKGSFGS